MIVFKKAGLPDGVTLNADGSSSGAVTVPDLAANLSVPIINLDLYGFFFAAKVEDAQVIPFDETAYYLIPTLPIGL